MNKILLSAATLLFAVAAQSQVATTSNGIVSFAGSSPVTDVEAESKKLVGALNLADHKFAFKIDMTSFDFPNDEMEAHFNEKYLETDKPGNRYTTFIGKINDNIDLKKDGTYKVSVSGKLKCHNVEKERNLLATLTVVGGKVSVTSEFFVPLKDHNIEVPSLVFAKVGENIKVKLEMVMK